MSRNVGPLRPGNWLKVRGSPDHMDGSPYDSTIESISLQMGKFPASAKGVVFPPDWFDCVDYTPSPSNLYIRLSLALIYNERAN